MFGTPFGGDVSLIIILKPTMQVEEPEALVDISLEGLSPGLVGESFPVSITISSAGHAVQAGDLEVYFAPTVNTEAGSTSTSPTTESVVIPAELLVRNSGDDPESKDNLELFAGLVEVPETRIGESWSAIL